MILLRRAEILDQEALAYIRRCAILTLAVPAISIEQVEMWATHMAADRITRAICDHDVWVAVEELAIGWVEIDRDRIAALYVLPSHARRGVGSILLAHAEAAIYRSGYIMAQLEASQNALDFYLRRGYRHCGLQAADGAWPLSKDLTSIAPSALLRPVAKC